MADDDLVAAAKAGDPEAWRTLYTRHAGRLEAWLRTRPTGEATASPEDVAHDAWLVAASRIADFEGSADDFAGWLFGIARKKSAASRRRAERRRTQPGEVAAHLPHAPGPAAGVEAGDVARQLLATLPPRERAVVGLVDGLGMEPRAAAEVLDISPVALRVARHRGLRRLRRRQASTGAVPTLPTTPAGGPDEAVAPATTPS